MNEYYEALKILCTLREDNGFELRDLTDNEDEIEKLNDKLFESELSIQKLVYRAIPKKPILANGNKCPNCSTLMQWEYPHCPFCGQVIDWSE